MKGYVDSKLLMILAEGMLERSVESRKDMNSTDIDYLQGYYSGRTSGYEVCRDMLLKAINGDLEFNPKKD